MIVKEGWGKVAKEVKKIVENKKFDLGDCFSTDSGRLKRRKCYSIYYGVIQKYPNDLTSIHIIRLALSKCLDQVVQDKIHSVSICNFASGQNHLNVESIARITVEECLKYDYKLDIKIVDTNKEFIKNVNKFLGIVE